MRRAPASVFLFSLSLLATVPCSAQDLAVIAHTKGNLNVKMRDVRPVTGISLVAFRVRADDHWASKAEYWSQYTSRFAGLPELPDLDALGDSLFSRGPIWKFFRVDPPQDRADTLYVGRVDIEGYGGTRSIIEHQIETVYNLPTVECHIATRAYVNKPWGWRANRSGGEAKTFVIDPITIGPVGQDTLAQFVIELDDVTLESEGIDQSKVFGAYLTASWSFTDEDGLPGFPEGTWSYEVVADSEGELDSFQTDSLELFRGTVFLQAGKTYFLRANLEAGTEIIRSFGP